MFAIYHSIPYSDRASAPALSTPGSGSRGQLSPLRRGSAINRAPGSDPNALIVSVWLRPSTSGSQGVLGRPVGAPALRGAYRRCLAP